MDYILLIIIQEMTGKSFLVSAQKTGEWRYWHLTRAQ